MPLTKEELQEIYKMSEMTCEQCNNYTGTRDLFSNVCLITKQVISDSGMVCDCDGFEEFKED